METLKITKKDFTAWLKARHPNRKVGECGHSGKCVIANYMNHKSGRQVWSVGLGSALRYTPSGGGGPEYRLPPWAQQLISGFDRLERPTAANTLRLLKSG